MKIEASVDKCPPLYFLDTSTQINRHWADEPISRQVRSDLAGSKLRTSIYVERQYRYRVLNAFISAHVFVITSDDIQDAKTRLENCRDDIGIDDLFYKFLRRLFRKYNSKKPLLRYLKRLIEVDWQNFFYDAIPKSLCDITNCTKGADAPQSRQGYYLPIPKRCPPNCNICDFWKAKKEDLQNLAATDPDESKRSADPKGTVQKIRTEAQNILEGKSPRDEHCKVISDAIISIEARDCYPGIIIHTMDFDFENLKEILGTKVRFFKVDQDDANLFSNLPGE
ncbi:MAG: hypothetical protein A2168_04775 [Planctomycetes bacterium RBG_13_50_24]|nr:MAG: hypothetical protein A2168_04775 [Planctomycetes bacterium RBG_13_50_24]